MTRKNMTLKFCKADILAIALVAALAILVSIIFWTSVGSEEGSMVMIYQEGKLVQELSLEKDTEFVIKGPASDNDIKLF